MGDFEDDDALDAELMRAFASYEDENSNEAQTVESNSLVTHSSKTDQNYESEDEPFLDEIDPQIERSEKTELSSITHQTKRVSSSVHEQLEQKKARVLENIRKHEGISASKFAENYSGPKYFDVHSGFTIGNPRLTQEDLKSKMEGKQNVKLGYLKDKIRNHALSDINFVVFGVVSKRYQPKKGNNDKSWCTFLVSDLRCCSLRLTVFHPDHVNLYREGEGVLIGVLNPNLKLEDEPIMSVNDARCILVLGRCLEFGFCMATAQKTGQRCQMPINRKMGDYCEFHILKAYKQSTSRRSHLQTSVPIEPLKEREKRAKMIESNQNKFIIHTGKQRLYENQTVGNRKIKTRPNMSSYSIVVNQNPAQSSGPPAVGANSGVQARDLDITQGNSNILNPDGTSVSIEDLLKRPTLGALNLKRSQDEAENETPSTRSSAIKRPVTEKFSARDLLNQHSDKLKTQSEVSKSCVSNSDLLDLNRSSNTLCILDSSTSSLSLPASINQVSNSVTLSDLRRMKAAAKLQSSGEGKRKEDIMKRVSMNRSNDLPMTKKPTESESSSMPAIKKQKVNCVNSQKENLIQNVLKLKSKFSTQLDDMEREHEEKYFNIREKKEQIEERLASTMEIKVRAVTCRQCCYIAPSLAMKCKVDNHNFTWSQETKRFFKCSDCSTRCISYRRYPTQPCSSCGGRRFDRTPMIEQNNKLPIFNTEYFKIADAEDFTQTSSSLN